MHHMPSHLPWTGMVWHEDGADTQQRAAALLLELQLHVLRTTCVVRTCILLLLTGTCTGCTGIVAVTIPHTNLVDLVRYLRCI
eukprot:SAG11_NODE_15523_length_575_cov_0.981092_1_plen_82_part_01